MFPLPTNSGTSPRSRGDGLARALLERLVPLRLALALLPALKATADPRVLNVTGGDKPARIDADNLQAEVGFKGLMTYTHSKSVMEAMSMIFEG
jgi:hypothetical protein